MLALKHLPALTRDNWMNGETLKEIQDAINLHGTTVGVSPAGAPFPAPAAPASIAVAAANGWFDVVLTDSFPTRGVEYWLEWDTDKNFTAPRQIHLMGARNWYGSLGNMTLYWRGAAAFLGSNLSAWTVYGGASPIAVVGGGSSGPAPMATSGSGAGPGIGAAKFPPIGVGRGIVPTRPVLRNTG